MLNLPPQANAGPDQTVAVNDIVQLDGSTSTDPDGNYPLTYSWTITQKPAGSAAALSDSTIAIPTFTADVPGDYTIELVVTDSKGKSSPADVVVISTINTNPVAAITVTPTAVIQHGTTVQLDGSESYDSDGDALTFNWSLTSPAGSSATLVNPTEIMPSFVPDIHGNYQVELVVTDLYGASSPATNATITFDNSPPVAIASYAEMGQILIEGDTLNLTGNGTDANLDVISSYTWTLIAPVGSTAVLSDANAQNPNFVADIAGDYTVSLVVQDEHGVSSASVGFSVTVITAAAAEDAVISLSDEIAAIDTNILKNANQQKALLNKIDVVLDLIAQSEYQLALDKLQNDILGKTNGCANSGNVTWDKNDWIQDCGIQSQLYTGVAPSDEDPDSGSVSGIIDKAIYYLERELGLI